MFNFDYKEIFSYELEPRFESENQLVDSSEGTMMTVNFLIGYQDCLLKGSWARHYGTEMVVVRER